MISYFPWKRALRSKALWFSLLVMLAFGLISALAPRLAPHDPYRIQLSKYGLPPMWVQNGRLPGEAAYPLGTDRYGHDVLSRLLYGTRTAFVLALTAVPLAALVGALAGLLAGYAGGWSEAVILYITDILQSLPGIMFLVIVVLILRGLLTPNWLNGLVTLVLGFALVSWTGLARQVRLQTLLVKSQLFIESAASLGASPRQIVAWHVLPNVLHVILVWVINNIPAVILLEAMLGYIGVGVTRTSSDLDFATISWGGIFFSGRSAINSNPLMLIIPSVCLLLISMSFILLADFLKGLGRQDT